MDGKVTLTLEQAVKSLSQVNLLLGGVGGLVLLGKSLYDQLKSAGATTAEATSEIRKFEAALNAASDKNSGWLAAHPKEGV